LPACRKKEREAKKCGKQVAAQRKQEKAQGKKAAITDISKLRKQREKSVRCAEGFEKGVWGGGGWSAVAWNRGLPSAADCFAGMARPSADFYVHTVRPLLLFLLQGFAGELDMDAELDKMEAGGGGGSGRGGGRQQKQQRKPGERFTAGADNRSKKREQRDTKYGGWGWGGMEG
jgi:rRNA-processing protein EBP2